MRYRMFSHAPVVGHSSVPSSTHRPLRATRFRRPVEPLERRCLLSTAYLATDLVSDQPGVAPVQDPDLVNAWGVSLNPNGGAFWVSSEGKDLSDLYAGDVNGSALSKAQLEVAIAGGHPTGQVFNPTQDFAITSGTTTRPALFIFASLSGTVTGWTPQVPPGSTNSLLGFQAKDGAIYTGIALANNGSGNFL